MTMGAKQSAGGIRQLGTQRLMPVVYRNSKTTSPRSWQGVESLAKQLPGELMSDPAEQCLLRTLSSEPVFSHVRFAWG